MMFEYQEKYDIKKRQHPTEQCQLSVAQDNIDLKGGISKDISQGGKTERLTGTPVV